MEYRTSLAVCFSLLVGLGSAGCDAGFVSEGPVTECIDVGAQCVTSKGPLGVCESVACAQGEASPCFVCTPQH